MKLSTNVNLILVVLAISLIGCLAAPETVAEDQQLDVVRQLPEVVPGVLQDQARIVVTPYSAKQCDGTRQSACSSCTEIKSCILADTTMDSMNPTQACPKNNMFCSMGTTAFGAVCQPTPDPTVESCATVTPPFECTGTGYFPDAYSCLYYYSCAGPGKTPEFYICPTGYRFSSKVNACVQTAAACPTFTCKMDDPNFVYQPHFYDTQYYVYCSYDTTKTPPALSATYVYSCGEGAKFNPTTGRCEYTCTKEGSFTNTAYPTQYYQCYRSGFKLVFTEKVCAADQIFVGTKCATLTG